MFKKLLNLISLTLLVALFGYGGYYFGSKKQNIKIVTLSVPEKTAVKTETYINTAVAAETAEKSVEQPAPVKEVSAAEALATPQPVTETS